ncbi:CRAL-TRIO domain-containing protein [Gautieria morchelliformis]|nr:CRAL-TRIO domain-containing protein [Gautieria morchelliformis]
MVRCGGSQLYAKQVVELSSQFRHKLQTSVGNDLLREPMQLPDMRKEQAGFFENAVITNLISSLTPRCSHARMASLTTPTATATADPAAADSPAAAQAQASQAQDPQAPQAPLAPPASERAADADAAAPGGVVKGADEDGGEAEGEGKKAGEGEGPQKADADADEGEEPQNALTRKFSAAEWAAVKELRGALSDVFKEAFPERADAGTAAVRMWGVELCPGRRDDARASVVLMKFLRARNLNVAEARSMLVSTLRWRAQFEPEAALAEGFPAEVFGGLGHVYGRDREGRPVTYNVYGANQDLKAVFGDIPRFLRWRVGLMERGVAQLDFATTDQMVQVHDYLGVGLSSRDANSKNAAAEATSIFTAHYPELLYKKFFVNVPTLMTWVFWAFRPLLPAATVAKMSVVGGGAGTIGRAVLPYVAAEELPAQYGGTAAGF